MRFLIEPINNLRGMKFTRDRNYVKCITKQLSKNQKTPLKRCRTGSVLMLENYLDCLANIACDKVSFV